MLLPAQRLHRGLVGLLKSYMDDFAKSNQQRAIEQEGNRSKLEAGAGQGAGAGRGAGAGLGAAAARERQRAGERQRAREQQWAVDIIYCTHCCHHLKCLLQNEL